MVTFYLFELFIHNPFDIKLSLQILNIILFEIIMLILLFLTGRARTALLVETSFSIIAGLANHYVLAFRSAPIMPWDIFSIGTAVSVANNYEYTIEKNILYLLASFVALLIVETRINWTLIPYRNGQSTRKKNFCIRLVGLLISFMLLCGFTKFMHADNTVVRFKIYDKLFTPTTVTKKNGQALAFLMELEYLSADKPSGYNKKSIGKLIEDYTSVAETPVKRPNIIVIMNEAFSDPAILGDFKTNEDYLPFVHSLFAEDKENVVTGYLNVSVLGGNTANSEFEFLTGNSMAFLPNGSIAYQQYVKKELPSIPLLLKQYGYQTVGMHPYNSTGWDRNKVYPILGFDESYFIKDWKNPHKIRKYISDESDYDKIINIFENKDSSTPMFVFNVTMQNHSSYTDEFDNFTPDITVEGVKSKALTNYLSLIKISDKAIENLIDYFSNQDEDTIIVMFGDHQTTNSVMSPIYKLNNKSIDELSQEEQNMRYKVPYFIWANFPLNKEKQSNNETSANFLGIKTLQAANLPLNGYFSYLSEVNASYPVVSAIRAQDEAGNSFEIKQALRNEMIKNYASLQYYLMFDN